jgi:site-specific DNA-methyltransferase (adenine-specific)
MNDRVTLHLGDCLEVLRSMEAGSVDALVTDPPYGIGFDYSGKREVTNNPADYWAWLGPIYREALRCVKPGGFVAVWQAQLNFRHFWDWFGDDIRIYAACKNFVQLRKTPINYGYDPVVMQFKPGADPIRAKGWRRTLDFFVANTANMKTRAASKGHPCPRPLDQVQEVVVNFVIEDGLVLDPFAGSGTTAVACLNSGRRFVGCEISPEYLDIARRRIAAALAETEAA